MDNEETEVLEEINYSTLITKVEETNYYLQHIYSAEVIFIGCIVAVLVIYIIYKFISGFFEF
jgi:hypothetical protein